jgi:phosphoribosylglycinamide formyltransferase-1
MVALICALQPDLLLLSGFMRILSAPALNALPMPVINQHPALLPADGSDTVTLSDGRTIPALRGAHVVRDALALRLPGDWLYGTYGCARSRSPPVLASHEVAILPDDTEETLHARIRSRTAVVDCYIADTLKKPPLTLSVSGGAVGNRGCD